MLEIPTNVLIHTGCRQGWTIKPYIACEVANALYFRTLIKGTFDQRNRLQPFYPIRQLARLVLAWRSVGATLKLMAETDHGNHR